MATKLHFVGAEVSTYRKQLLGLGVESMALNLSAYIRQRQPTTLKDSYAGIDMVLYSSEGGLDPNKVNGFIEANADAFTMIYGITTDHPAYVPVWHGGEINGFYRMAEGRQRIGVDDAVATDPALMRYVSSFAAKNRVALVTSGSKAEAIRQHWDELILNAWLAAAKHRELQVWDGSHVARYSRAHRATAVEKHRGQLTALGVDPQALIDDVTDELIAVAVRSWLIYGVREARVVDISPLRAVSDGTEGEGGTIATLPRDARQRERTIMPVLAHYETEVNEDDGSVEIAVAVNHRALRTCSSCNLSQACPSFEAGATCAFEIPMRITNKAELKAAQSAFLEIQAHRIFFARFSEDVLSQGLDPGLSSEIERFFRMAEAVKRGDQVIEQVTITATAGNGAITRLFGAAAGEANTRLAAPMSANALTEMVFDAEVIDPEDHDNG